VTVVVVLEYRQYRRATTTSAALRLASVHTTFIVGGAAASTRSCIAIADKKITRKHCEELDIDIGNGPVLLNKSARILVSPSIVRYFRHPYCSDRVRELPLLCHLHIDLSKLRNDLFSRMPLPCHRSYPPSENHTVFLAVW
jgi:hypothetical protein